MIYFVSDVHLGSKLEKDARAHEKKIVDWLDLVKKDATAIYLLGDIFDFWFEYRTVVPKGFTRFFGKLAELVDAGIEMHYFTGNHDIWAFSYFEQEIGLKVHYEPLTVKLGNKTFFLAHGDGLDADERGFKVLRKLFHSQLAAKLFRLIPPQIGQGLGYLWSKKSREKILHLDTSYKGEEKESLVKFAKTYAEKNDVDFLIFGHRHIDLDLQIKDRKRIVILGDFVSIFSYGVFDGENFWLEYLS